MAATAAGMVVVFVGVVYVASTVGPLRHASLPGHPYPPAGYVRNPFTSNPDDLLSIADAARVRSDFERDGQVELEAFATGDAGALSMADAGGRLQTLQQQIAQNNAAGIIQRYDNHVGTTVVGRRPTPGGASTAWHVEEQGTASLTDIEKATGRALRTRTYRFDGRFWLTVVGDRYLITDAAISNEPTAGG